MGVYDGIEILLPKMRKFFLNRVQKIRSNIPYIYGKILKQNEMLSLNYDVNDYVYTKSKYV